MKIRIIGDSHVIALRAAWKRIATPEHDIRVAFMGAALKLHRAPAFYEEREGRVYLTREPMLTKVRALMGRDYLQNEEALLGLCLGLHLERIFQSTAWQAFAPWHLAAETGLQPVSQGVLESFFSYDVQHVLGFFDALSRCGVRFFVLSGPPPRRGHKAMKRGTSPRVVLEVTRLYGEFFRRQVALRGYRIVEAPEGILDEDGFLKREYERNADGDESHGNWRYGALHIAKMLDEVTSSHMADGPGA